MAPASGERKGQGVVQLAQLRLPPDEPGQPPPTGDVDVPARGSQTQGGDGQVVGIIADPGLGKSRLVSEFVQDIRKQGIEVHEAHCQAHTRTLPLVPALEMLRSYFGITEDLGPKLARASHVPAAGREAPVDKLLRLKQLPRGLGQRRRVAPDAASTCSLCSPPWRGLGGPPVAVLPVAA